MRDPSPASAVQIASTHRTAPPHQGSIPALDLVRFTTAVVVMLFHLCYWRNGHTPPASDALNHFWWFGWVGVEIFFTLSGFVIVFSACKASPRQFAMSRGVRLFPTIWLCSTITLLLTLLLSPQLDIRSLAGSYLNTLWVNPKGGHIDIVYWTLTVEISFYALVFCMLYLGDFNLVLKTLMTLGCASAAFNIGVFFADVIHPIAPKLSETLLVMDGKQTFRLLLLKHGVFFALGALLWHRRSAHRKIGTHALLTLFCVGATMEVWGHGRSHLRDIGSSAPSIIIVLSAWWVGLCSIALGATETTTRWIHAHMSARLIRRLGLLTFPLYLLHNIGGLLMKNTLQRHDLNDGLSTLMAMFLSLLIATAVAEGIEPPVARWLKRQLNHQTA